MAVLTTCKGPNCHDPEKSNFLIFNSNINMHCSEKFRLFYITSYFVFFLLLEIDIVAVYNLH